MKKLLGDLVDLIFPNICPGCAEPFVSGEKTLCARCTLDLPVHTHHDELLKVFAGRIKIAEIAVFLKFYAGGITQRILHDIKYNRNLELARFMGRTFMYAGVNHDIFKEIDVIVPVPLHSSKLKTRGYNQSELIAEGMAAVLHKPVNSNGIRRIKSSATQTRKSRAERWQNVSGIFEVIDERYKDKHVLLVDDVLTTGATMEACGMTLLNSGVKKLSIAALAMA